MATQPAVGNGWQASSRTGVVAAGHAAAVAAGIELLASGGNAADAAVATILALTVTDHGECSIGGEVPLMIYSASQRQVRALSGQGGAPLSPAAIEWYMAHGIPAGDIRMAPVPAVVDLCVTTLQHYGTRSFTDAVAPALALLDAGDQPWHPRLARTLRRLAEEEVLTPGPREEKLQAVGDRFYGRHATRRDVAEELEAFYRERGGFLRLADLQAHRTRIEAPVTTDYRGYTVCKCDTWTQGPWLCQALRLLEGFDLQALGHLSPDYIHAAVEATKLAMADRDEHYGDPEFATVPLAALLSDAYTQVRRPLIDMTRASHEVRPGDPLALQAVKRTASWQPGIGGTTTCVVADRWGNVVAATPSANVCHDGYHGGPAGVTYGNRLLSLNTTPGHPNCIAPGKRPRITLTPTLVLRQGKPVVALSVAGGDLQDQATLSLLLAHVEFGLSPAEAVRAPRFATAHHEDSFNPDPDRHRTFKQVASLTISDVVDGRTLAELERRGHRVAPQGGPIAHPVMLQCGSGSGQLLAAGDPEAGRHAAGVPD
jgi:gamma-glutamyltranspeptidase/glutathione hydrolase